MVVPTLLPPERVAAAAETAGRVLAALDRTLLGRPRLHRLVVAALLARGHVLLEGLPGVGKTELVKAMAAILELDFKRLQFTPDLMPADIVGCHVLDSGPDGHRQLRFEPGPVFTHLLLADEINRASPKTQSALLEAMGERSVSLLGTTRHLEEPFLVLASQNPVELEGTYPLPEAQLDRFLIKLIVEPADVETLTEILSSRRHGRPPTPDSVLDREGLLDLAKVQEGVVLPAAVASWIARLVAATGAAGESPQIAASLAYPASPRAAIAMAEMARAWALLDGRPSVGFEDVRAVAPAVLRHRLLLTHSARIEGLDGDQVATALLDGVSASGVAVPGDVEIG